MKVHVAECELVTQPKGIRRGWVCTCPSAVLNTARMRHHSFNDEGRCVHCDIRWVHAIGTVCDNENPTGRSTQ